MATVKTIAPEKPNPNLKSIWTKPLGARNDTSRKKRLIKRIVITNILSVFVVILAYFWLFFSLRNLDYVWGIFRRKETVGQTDTIPPTAPYLQQIPEATQNDSIDVTGGSEQGVKVKLYIDDQEKSETISDNNGVFTFTGVQVGSIKEKIYVKAVDENNNVSSKSEEFSIYRDNEPPIVEISNPNKESVHYKAAERSYVVTGKSEPDSTVLVNGQLAIVSTDGTFSVTIRLEEGKNEMKIEVKDKAENKFEESRFVNFTKIDT